MVVAALSPKAGQPFCDWVAGLSEQRVEPREDCGDGDDFVEGNVNVVVKPWHVDVRWAVHAADVYLMTTMPAPVALHEEHQPMAVDLSPGTLASCSCGWESQPLSGLGRETLHVWGGHIARACGGDAALGDEHVPRGFEDTPEGAYLVHCSCGWISEPTSWLTRHLMSVWGGHIALCVVGPLG